ncbi:MAG: hypothetical protein IT437_13305 [Phycisphaerales bacterium]|nr:hypothetical protein [Phycisphaerales bacterium]
MDTKGMCRLCGYGVQQGGPLRLPASALRRCKRVASLDIAGVQFFLSTEAVLRGLMAEDEMASLTRAIDQIGAKNGDGEWWQWDPSYRLPAEATREVRYERAICSECGVVRLESESDIPDGYVTCNVSVLRERAVPPLLLSPYLWQGRMTCFVDGRVVVYPQHKLLLRGDVGRALVAMRIPGVMLTPILPTHPSPA